MQNKVVQQTLIPAKTLAWFLSPDHVFFGLFNLLWCLLSQHKVAGFTYIAFMLLSMVYKVRYLPACCIAMFVGLLAGEFLS